MDWADAAQVVTVVAALAGLVYAARAARLARDAVLLSRVQALEERVNDFYAALDAYQRAVRKWDREGRRPGESGPMVEALSVCHRSIISLGLRPFFKLHDHMMDRSQGLLEGTVTSEDIANDTRAYRGAVSGLTAGLIVRAQDLSGIGAHWHQRWPDRFYYGYLPGLRTDPAKWFPWFQGRLPGPEEDQGAPGG